MHDILVPWLRSLGLSAGAVRALDLGAAVVALGLAAVLALFITRGIVLRLIRSLVQRTETHWDDLLVKRPVLTRLAHLAPALVLDALGPLLLSEVAHPTLISSLQKLVAVYMIVVGAFALSAAFDVVHDVYSRFEASRRVPIKGIVQVAKVVLFCVASIVVLALLLNKTPVYLLSGLGALTAVLLIVFRDPILGLVAGIQLSANRMVAIGDWIEMPSHGADGDVIEVALTTVKVQNWDKTITTIPTYDLISKAFKNWRGMKEAGGRRIKRALLLDMNAVRFCDEKLLARLGRIELLREYLERKRAELSAHNQAVDPSSPINGRRLTNLGTFRAYVAAYLRAQPAIRKDLTFLVRQLPPDEHGLPLELYVFTNDTVWASYEAIQADIFDHLLAVLPEFELRVFQAPSGADVRELIAERAA
jgi:miniconductance mechanosensitive channel